MLIKDKKILYECINLIKKNPKLKKKKLNRIKNLEKRLYYIKVWSLTESQPLHKLKNHEKRCFYGRNCYHLDHKCSISEGFKNGILPEIIGRMDNLKFIPAKQNMKKGYKVTRHRLQETLKKSKRFNKKR